MGKRKKRAQAGTAAPQPEAAPSSSPLTDLQRALTEVDSDENKDERARLCDEARGAWHKLKIAPALGSSAGHETAEAYANEAHAQTEMVRSMYSDVVKVYRAAINDIKAKATIVLNEVGPSQNRRNARINAIKKIESLNEESAEFEKGFEELETEEKISRLTAAVARYNTFESAAEIDSNVAHEDVQTGADNDSLPEEMQIAANDFLEMYDQEAAYFFGDRSDSILTMKEENIEGIRKFADIAAQLRQGALSELINRSNDADSTMEAAMTARKAAIKEEKKVALYKHHQLLAYEKSPSTNETIDIAQIEREKNAYQLHAAEVKLDMVCSMFDEINDNVTAEEREKGLQDAFDCSKGVLEKLKNFPEDHFSGQVADSESIESLSEVADSSEPIENLPAAHQYVAYEAFAEMFDNLAQQYMSCINQAGDENVQRDLAQIMADFGSLRNDMEISASRVRPAPDVSAALRNELRERYQLDRILEIEEQPDIAEEEIAVTESEVESKPQARPPKKTASAVEPPQEKKLTEAEVNKKIESLRKRLETAFPKKDREWIKYLEGSTIEREKYPTDLLLHYCEQARSQASHAARLYGSLASQYDLLGDTRQKKWAEDQQAGDDRKAKRYAANVEPWKLDSTKLALHKRPTQYLFDRLLELDETKKDILGVSSELLPKSPIAERKYPDGDSAPLYNKKGQILYDHVVEYAFTLRGPKTNENREFVVHLHYHFPKEAQDTTKEEVMAQGKLAAQVFKTKADSRLSAADAKSQGIELHHADANPKIVDTLKALAVPTQARGLGRSSRR